jgi:hypothetical protein
MGPCHWLDAINFTDHPPIAVTMFVVAESATHRKPLHVGDPHANIEFTNPAHCVKYAYSLAHRTTCEPTRKTAALT